MCAILVCGMGAERYLGRMTTSRIALVTGANQGLGRALVEALAAGMTADDRVLLTGRDPGRVEAATAAVEEAGAVAAVEGRVLDVRNGDAIATLAEELGAVDIVFSNATARMSPDADPADEVDAVDAIVADWRASVLSGRAVQDGFGTWLNIPSKVAQVAAVRAIARDRRDDDLAAGRLIMALCPGLIDTDASRPWFDDMSNAQTPAQAAAWPVSLALSATFDPAFYGELVQFGKVLPWESGIPVPHTAVA